MGDTLKSKLYKFLVIILYAVSLFILLTFLKVRFTSYISIEPNIRLILTILSFVLIYINGYILVKKLNYSKKILKIHLIIYFIVYTVLLLVLTLFDELFGRKGLMFINWNNDLLSLYIKYSFNMIPFKTISLFIKGFINESVNFRSFSINIIGNLCAFMPYSLLLPLIFKKMNKFLNFLITIVITVVVIELLQFVTMSGSCDIDDLILNVFGSSIIYLIINIKPINKIIRKIFLFE